MVLPRTKIEAFRPSQSLIRGQPLASSLNWLLVAHAFKVLSNALFSSLDQCTLIMKSCLRCVWWLREPGEVAIFYRYIVTFEPKKSWTKVAIFYRYIVTFEQKKELNQSCSLLPLHCNFRASQKKWKNWKGKSMVIFGVCCAHSFTANTTTTSLS